MVIFRKIFRFFAVFIIALLIIPASLQVFLVIAQEEPDIEHGTNLFQQACSVCHGPDGLGVTGLGKTLVGSEFVDSLSDDKLFEFIRTGRAVDDPLNTTGVAMPPSGGRVDFTDEDINDIIAYVRSLSAGEVVEETQPEQDTITDETPQVDDSESTFTASLDLTSPAEHRVVTFAESPRDVDPAEAALGRYLFYDTRLSADSSTSCSTCHQPDKGWTDGLALSNGYPSTMYFRNTPTLINSAYYDVLYWDARLDGDDMQSTVRDHLTEAHFMAVDGRLMTERLRQVPEYIGGFNEVYGSGPSFGRVLKALSAYVWSLNSGISPYDEYMAGDVNVLSDEAQRGMILFEQSGCSDCHSGPVFTDSGLYQSSVPENSDIFATPERHITFRRFFRGYAVSNYRTLRSDVGAFILYHDDEQWGAFRTPTLRELAYTAPYMHNGIFLTLDEVVNYYNTSQSLELSDQDLADLVSFLESLSSDLPETEAPDLPGFALRELGDNK
jgi:cytochrome c peroxidase